MRVKSGNREQRVVHVRDWRRVDAHRYRAVAVGTPLVTTLPCKRGPNGNSEALSPFVQTPPGAPESADLKPAVGVRRFENRERKQGTPFPVKTVTCLRATRGSIGRRGRGPTWCLQAFSIKNAQQILVNADRAESCRTFYYYVGKQPKRAAAAALHD